MTDMLLVRSPRVTGGDDRTTVRRLADELLAAHEEAGACVAALVDESSVLWEAAQPWVARLVAEARRTVHRLACLEARADSDVSSRAAMTGSVPPVVWARQVGVVQRGMWRAVRKLEGEETAGQEAAVLREALGRTQTVAAALRAAALT